MTTTSTLVSSLNPSTYGESVTFTVSVVSDDLVNFPGPPTGTATFYEGATALGTRTLDGSGNATLTTASLDVAGSTHDITAVYNGDGTFDPSTSNDVFQQVDKATPTVALSSSTAWLPIFPGTTGPGTSVTFTGIVTPPGAGTPTGTITFKLGTDVLGVVALSGGQADVLINYADSPVPALTPIGAYNVTAEYSGDSNFNTGSDLHEQDVGHVTHITFGYPLRPVYIAGPPVMQQNQTVIFGTPVTLIAAVAVHDPTLGGFFSIVSGATGTMTFYEGSTVLGVVAVDPGPSKAFLTLEFPVGSHGISAVYSGDANFTPGSTEGEVSRYATVEVIPASGGEGPPPPLPPAPSPGPGQPAPTPHVAPKFTCAEKIDCACLDSPVLNLSSEAVDFPNFFCLNFGEQVPPLGMQFGETSCVVVGNSTVTQEAACLNGALNSTYCITNTWVPPTIPPPPLPDPIDPPPGTFGNTPQTASVTCANGQVVSFTVPANTFIATTQEEANLIALDFADAYADLLALATPGCTGQNPPPVPPPPRIFLNKTVSCDAFCPDGLAFVFTVHAGTFASMSQELADRMAYTYACRQAQIHRVCLSSLSPASCCLGVSSTINIVATGADVSLVANFWEIISGSVPPGMTFFPAIGGPIATISGTPTVAGAYAFKVRVTLTNGDFMEKSYTLCVVELLPALLPDATPGAPYSQALSTNCATVTTWILSSGSLPAGMTLHTDTGIIDGTPTTAGVYTFEVEATTL